MIKEFCNRDDEFFINTAFNLAKRSHCVSKHVGAVLVKDGRIVSMGYNGSPAGHVNCDSVFNAHKFDLDDHHHWSITHEVHAEMNCIMFAAKNGIETDGCTLYTTLSPCQDCLKNSLQAGIVRFVFLNQYHRNTIPNELFRYMIEKDIKIEKLVPVTMYLSKTATIEAYIRNEIGYFNEQVNDALYYHTSWIPDKYVIKEKEFSQRFYHLANDLKHIPMKPDNITPEKFISELDGYEKTFTPDNFYMT